MTRRWSLLGWFGAICEVRAAAQSAGSNQSRPLPTIGVDAGLTKIVPPAVQYDGTVQFGYNLDSKKQIKPKNGQCPRCGWRASKLTKALMDKHIEQMTLLMSQPDHPGALEYYHGSKPKVLIECSECRNAFVQYAE